MPWTELLTVWYVLIDDACQELVRRHGDWRRRGPPLFSDSEVITVALFSDLLMDGHEAKTLHCLRQHDAGLFPRLPSTGCFNARRTWLVALTEQVRQELSRQHALLPVTDRGRLLDSAPIALCTDQRGGECESVAQAAAGRLCGTPMCWPRPAGTAACLGRRRSSGSSGACGAALRTSLASWSRSFISYAPARARFGVASRVSAARSWATTLWHRRPPPSRRHPPPNPELASFVPLR
jgi:hypothetical protein